MRRITIEEVKAAYQRTGLRPAQRCFLYYDRHLSTDIIPEWDGLQKLDGRACALGVVAVAESITTLMARDKRRVIDVGDTIIKYLELDPEYARGFLCGFDFHWVTPTTENEKLGVADGKAAREALFP